MKHSYIILIGLATQTVFFSTSVLSQVFFNTEPNYNNVTKAQNLVKPSSADFDSLFVISEKYTNTNIDTALLLFKLSGNLLENFGDNELKIQNLLHLGNANKQIGNYEDAKEVALKIIDLSNRYNLPKFQAKGNTLLGSIEKSLGNYSSSIDYFIEAGKFWEDIDEPRNAAEIYDNISAVFFELDELKKSQKYIDKVKVIADELKDDLLKIDALAGQAVNFMTEGIHYYLKHEADTSHLQQAMDTLNYYFNKSELTYIDGLELARQVGDNTIIVELLNNYVALSMNMGKFDQAESLALEAEEKTRELTTVELRIQALFNLCSLNRNLKNFDESTSYGLQSLALAKKHALPRKVHLANRILYELYKVKGDYENAIPYVEEMRKYEKQTISSEKLKAVADIDAKYESVKKEKKILELNHDAMKLKKQRNLIFGGGLISLLFGFLIYRILKIGRDRNDKKAFAEALIFAQEEERKRIARDLHDGVGQSLLFIKKQLEKNQKTTVENQSMISDALEEVRSLSRDLHPFQLEKFGLKVTLEDLLEKIEKSTEIFVSHDIEDNSLELNDNAQIHIYRTIQEALSNIIKHANATAIKLEVFKSEGHLKINIRDNGIGFDAEWAIVKSKSLGLKTMHERISSLKGELKIKNGSPKGTIIEISIPN